MIKKFSYIVLALFCTGILLGALSLAYLVIIAPGDAIRQENIESILAVESPVYYRDGVSKIGVMFEESHRQYVPYEKIPKDFVNALLAAEDRNFFDHFGVDFFGILRALAANVRSGRIVQGGSTITQQTAKNLFKRKDRSLVSKLYELLFALRLEYHYPKEKILEFYANQFFVSGNGRGLGVAARYFFDKSVPELDTLECAFIAASVKSPNHFNPFTKKDEMSADKAREFAKQRTDYVLSSMAKLGFVSQEQYQRNRDRNIPFKRGKMYFALDTIMDRVKEALATPQAVESLSVHGIDNVATSGIRVITTVDRDVQAKTLYGLRKELSRLDVRLQGYDRDALQAAYREVDQLDSGEPAPGNFLFGTVEAVEAKESPALLVSFSQLGEHSGSRIGKVDVLGLRALVDPYARGKKDRGTGALPAEALNILKQIQKGDVVLVSVREKQPDSGEVLLDLEKYPEVQGAAVVLKDGVVRGLAGGFANRYFNRAIAAKRSMGSVMKPIVYCAALQLGWNNIDALNNTRNVFAYQHQAYFPRPDHISPFKEVSMTWAGVNSENLASVWLLYHLCDHLSLAQLKEVMQQLGWAREETESYESYVRRIRDELGIMVDRETLWHAAFEKALTDIRPDVIFSGNLREIEALNTLQYGTDFDSFLAQEEAKNKAGEIPDGEQELAERKALLQHNFLRYWGLKQELDIVRSRLEKGEEVIGEEVSTAEDNAQNQGRFYYDEKTDFWIYCAKKPRPWWQVKTGAALAEQLRAMSDEGRTSFWQEILVEGDLSVETLNLLNDSMAKAYAGLAARAPYSPEVLQEIRDFRVAIGLRYIVSFCRALGIESDLDPVLSFPLGSNVLSLLEAARAYEGLVTGFVWRPEGRAGVDGLELIARIENSDGETIFEPKMGSKRVVDERTSLALSDILRNVVRYGTGRNAERSVRLRIPKTKPGEAGVDMVVPVFGKTGTANRFTNAAFLGFLPDVAATGEGVTIQQGYALGAYVGFDDNKPMVHKGIHISGALGALPVWSQVANAVIKAEDYAGRFDLVDLTFSGQDRISVVYPELGQQKITVNAKNGLIQTGDSAGDGEGAVSLTFGEITGKGNFEPTRFFEPFWRAAAKMEGN